MTNSINVSLSVEERNMIWQALYGIRAYGRYGADNRHGQYRQPNEKLDMVDKIMKKMKVT